jgi:hypothetical protein
MSKEDFAQLASQQVDANGKAITSGSKTSVQVTDKNGKTSTVTYAADAAF